MKCNVLNFSKKETVIILRAGHKTDQNYSLETKILTSITAYITEFEPSLTDRLYGRVADILLYGDQEQLRRIKGIGVAAIKRIEEIRKYMNDHDIYRFIFTNTSKPKTEDKAMLTFGDADSKESKKMYKEYRVGVNGFVYQDLESERTKYAKKEYAIALTEEELNGIRKMFKVLDNSNMAYITGLGVDLNVV